MSTQGQTHSTNDRMKREELQMDERDDKNIEDNEYREVRDEDVIDTRAEEVSGTATTKPIITPAMPETPTATETKAIDQSTAPAEGARVPNAGFGTPTLPEHDSAEATEHWQRIQAEFVDDPRKAVGEAHELVGKTVQSIVDAFTKERNELESQWSKGSDVSTEDLRVCLQHYKAFFSRLSWHN
jgi:hypothetical protein